MIRVCIILAAVTLSTAKPFKCPGNGLFPDPDNCQCYWECANLQPFYHCCADDTLFHEILHVCDYPYHVDCGDRPKPGDTTTTNKPTTSTTSTQTTTTSSDLSEMCKEFMTASCPLDEDNLVGDLVTEDAANCQEYCSQSPECEWFTWYKPLLRCYLLASCHPPEECECCVSGPQAPVLDVDMCQLGC